MVQYLPPNDFGFSVDNLLRVGFENCLGGAEAHIGVSLWDFPEDQAASLKKRLEEALTRIFP